MELRQIKDLMAAMSRHGVKRLRFEKGEVRLELEQADSSSTGIASEALGEIVHEANEAAVGPRKKRLPSASERTVAESSADPKEEDEEGMDFVTSPIVGTFYSSPSPDEPPFVKPGDKVEPNTVICIVEAMKVMNEVKAGIRGVVQDVLVDNAHPVEFGTKLFKISQK